LVSPDHVGILKHREAPLHVGALGVLPFPLRTAPERELEDERNLRRSHGRRLKAARLVVAVVPVTDREPCVPPAHRAWHLRAAPDTSGRRLPNGDIEATVNPTVVLQEGRISEAESSSDKQADGRNGHECCSGPADDLGEPPIRIITHKATAPGDQHDHD